MQKDCWNNPCHAHHLRAVGLYRQTGRPGAQTARTRSHGVFAPHSKHRVQVTPAKRGKGNQTKAPDEAQDQTPAERRAAMIPEQVRGRLWAQRLKRVFNIDIETCGECGAAVKVIACIEDSVVIKKILTT